MNKDEIQLSKALIKLRAIKRIINILQDLNLLENEKEMKNYSIILDYYNNDQDFTTFKVNINCKGLDKHNTMVNKPLFNFNFKLKDDKTGFAIFKIIREYFVKKNDLKYPGFQINYNSRYDGLKYLEHKVETNHHVSLISKIHSKTDEAKLEKFNNEIYEKYKSYITKIHMVDNDKDEIQILKAEKKKEIVFVIIDMLNELVAASDSNSKSYEIFMKSEKYYDSYRFNIIVSKNNKSTPLKISFKLKDEKEGIKIFNEIVNYYIENVDIAYCCDSDDYNNKVNYTLIGKNSVNINYIIPGDYSKEAITDFKNSITLKKEAKTLQKAK